MLRSYLTGKEIESRTPSVCGSNLTVAKMRKAKPKSNSQNKGSRVSAFMLLHCDNILSSVLSQHFCFCIKATYLICMVSTFLFLYGGNTVNPYGLIILSSVLSQQFLFCMVETCLKNFVNVSQIKSLRISEHLDANNVDKISQRIGLTVLVKFSLPPNFSYQRHIFWRRNC